MIHILNGPNLNLLGQREPSLYGVHTLKDIEQACCNLAQKLNTQILFRQTNHEGVLIDWVQEAGVQAQGLLINGGGCTHTSVSLLDALLAIKIPIIEVHLTLPMNRESFRHTSFITPAARGLVAGFGLNSYTLGLRALCEIVHVKEVPV